MVRPVLAGPLLFLLACPGDEPGKDRDSEAEADSATDTSDSADTAPPDSGDCTPIDETCNGLDDDCDGEVDEDALDAATWYLDADGDGHGDPAAPLVACDAPTGHVAEGTDCDDTDPAIYPGAEETGGDGLDSECDGEDALPRPEGELWLAEANRRWYGEAEGDNAGMSTAGGEDLDGDGFDDLVVGAFAEQSTSTGSVCVLRGGSPVASGSLASADVVLRGPEASSQAGLGVAILGDLTGSGQPVVVLGAPFADAEGGAVYACDWPALSAGSLDACGLAVTGEARTGDYGRLGFDVSGGDVDGDGQVDLVMSAPYASGVVYVQLGPVDGEIAAGDADIRLEGEPGTMGYGGWPGWALDAAADGDGDGIDDILVGAPYLAIESRYDGRVYMVSGAIAGGSALADVGTGLDGEMDDYAGWSVAWAGDGDGDGYAEALVGAPGSDGLAEISGCGRAYLLPGPLEGSTRLAEVATTIVEGDEKGASLGESVAAAGDIDGDGALDMAVGVSESLRSEADARAGSVCLLYGPLATGTLLPSACDARWTGEAVGDKDLAGTGVNGAGDVNGDGFDDLLVGAAWSDVAAEKAGAAYLLFGGGGG